MKSACEQFREYLVRLQEERHDEDVGEILHTFDDLHQSRRENTGERCTKES